MLRRKKLREKYAVLWLVVGVATLVLAAFPRLLNIVAEYVGVQIPSNLLFAMSILMLLGVCLHLSWEISVVEDETRTLAEEVGHPATQTRALEQRRRPVRAGRGPPRAAASPLDPPHESPRITHEVRTGPAGPVRHATTCPARKLGPKMPLDIFVPYWGDPGYMKETVRSVLAQDNDDWLLTVVDDAYPGPEIAEYMAGIHDPRVSTSARTSTRASRRTTGRCVGMATPGGHGHPGLRRRPAAELRGRDPAHAHRPLPGRRHHPAGGPGHRRARAGSARTLADTVKQKTRPAPRPRHAAARRRGDRLAT